MMDTEAVCGMPSVSAGVLSVRLAILLVFISGTASTPGSYNVHYKVTHTANDCVDAYERYCRSLTAQRCYIKSNLRLCCQTCADHFHRFLHKTLPETKCYFGDRDTEYCYQPTDRCYEEGHQHVCCRTCFQALTGVPDCMFGDRDQEHCSKIQPYECYNPTIASLCCDTCAKFETNIPDCRYGDHVHLESVDWRQYTCAAYVGHFGQERCNTNDVFRANCCASCA